MSLMSLPPWGRSLGAIDPLLVVSSLGSCTIGQAGDVGCLVVVVEAIYEYGYSLGHPGAIC